MRVSPHMQAWIDQTRKESLRMSNWKLLRRLAALITFSMMSGLAAEFVLTSRSLAVAFYVAGACASIALLVHAFWRRLFVTKPAVS